VRVELNLNSVDDYRTFLKVKGLPRFTFTGRTAEFPDEYADTLGLKPPRAKAGKYTPLPGLFDYQREIAKTAVRKRKYAVFAECGLGKTLILLEYARHAAAAMPTKGVLIVSPLMVVNQTVAEAKRFYGDSLPIRVVRAAELPQWLATGKGVAITNYEAIRDGLDPGNLGGLICDESSLLKSHYGKWGTRLIELGKGLGWKLCLTGTPAPNDRIEFANHAVFLDHEPTVNSFLARYFVNRGETANRWELKAHALKPFYRSLSHWCIFLTNPATYGWKDNTATVPPINVHIHDVDLTADQRDMVQRQTGSLWLSDAGGITSRSKLSQMAKGRHNGEAIDTNKTEFIRDLVNGFGGRSSIIWCVYNAEQEIMAATFPAAANVSGDTPKDDRADLVRRFQAGELAELISKPKVLGFGLNLQVCTRMVFSGIQDSYESYHQAVKRANRVGSTEPLEVHIPVTEIERPMLDTVLRKASRVQQDTAEQEAIFREVASL
jgi:superfamily II DNA or RNA helicase